LLQAVVAGIRALSAATHAQAIHDAKREESRDARGPYPDWCSSGSAALNPGPREPHHDS